MIEYSSDGFLSLRTQKTNEGKFETMRKLLAILMILSMVFAMTVCASAETTPETRTVTDVWNREVEIPYEVNSIVCLGSMGPRFAAYLNVVDMMVGA